MIRDAKKYIYCSSIIAKNKGNQKVLLQTIDQLLQRKQEPHFPTSTSSERLANEFAAFFHEKISKMRCSLSHDSESIINPIPDLSCCQSELTGFCTENTDDIRKYSTPSTLHLTKRMPRYLITCHQKNRQLVTGNARHFKKAMVRPKLKKDSLDYQLFSHFL